MSRDRPRPGFALMWRLAGLGGLILAGLAALYSKSTMTSVQAAGPVEPAPIDGERAYLYLKQICALGPRPAGSAANLRQIRMVASHFQKCGGVVREQAFRAVDPESGQPVTLTNLIGSWAPERPDRVLLCAHYDTRPHPDQEVNPNDYRKPFVGANDGASGVALLMEIAHHLKDFPTPYGVDLVLFDGEELVYGDNGEYFLGSREFARAYPADLRQGRIAGRYRAGILLDMVGGKDLALKYEPYSARRAPQIVKEVWGVAAQLGVRAFRRSYGRQVLDDHIPLNEAGIPTIDLIDFDYPHWHRATDVPENCSARSLEDVGKVVTAWLALPPQRGR